MRFIYTKTFFRAFVLFVAVAGFIILDATGFLGFIKAGFNKTYGAATYRTASAASGVRQIFATIFTIKNLAKDNASLNQKINELSFENARLQSAKVENSALRKALNFQEDSELDLIPAEVIMADPTGFSQLISIDKGANDGVRENAAVIASPGLLVGKITKVSGSNSEATLITDPKILVNAVVAESAARGLVSGEHGLGLIFGLVTQNEVIKVQDRVVTSGLSGDFPQGLLIGEISSVRSNSSQLFQEAFISPAADLKHLNFVFVIK